MSSYKPPKHLINNHFNPHDFASKDDPTDGEALVDMMAPPLVDTGVMYFKDDGKIHTDADFVFDDVSGNVGIGTDNPLTTLSVEPNINGPKLTMYDANDALNHTGFATGNDGSLFYHVKTNADKHIFQSTGKSGNGNVLMVVQGDGNVCIGTSTPQPNSKLTIQGNNYLSGNETVNGNLSVNGSSSLTGNVTTSGNVTLSSGNLSVGGNVQANGNLSVVGPSTFSESITVNGKVNFATTATPQLALTSGNFNQLTTTGLTANCSTSDKYPLLIKANNEANNNIRAAIGFTDDSSVNPVPYGDITMTKYQDNPKRGKFDVNLITTNTNRENVLSLQTDRALITKKVGLGLADPIVAPKTQLEVNGDIIASKICLGGDVVPTNKLQFSTDLESKIALIPGNAGTFCGLGVSTNNLNYQCPTGANHSFRVSGLNSDGTLLAQIKNTGELCLSTETAVAKLTFDNANGNKICLYSTDGPNMMGIGLGSRNDGSTTRKHFNFQIENAEDEFMFWSLRRTTNDASLTQNEDTRLMRVFYSENFNRPQVYIGTGLSREYQLELQQNSAGKPSSGSWTISSDARLKENIELANLDICFDIVKNLPLKKFKWKDEVYTKEQVPDRNMIGFIADDVELFFKKAVTKRAIHGLEDCRDLDENLIFKAHYGATQQLIKLVENLSQKVEKLEADNETLKTELSELKKLVF